MKPAVTQKVVVVSFANKNNKTLFNERANIQDKIPIILFLFISYISLLAPHFGQNCPKRSKTYPHFLHFEFSLI